MQILGILDASGKAIPNVQVVMFRSDADCLAIADAVDNREVSHIKREKLGPFNRTAAAWDQEFEIHKSRLRRQLSKTDKIETGFDLSDHEAKHLPEIRCFPAEVREYANNRTVVQRLREHNIGL